MNRLKGNIAEIQDFDGLSLLTVNVCGTHINSIIINDGNGDSFSVNKEVELVFKETEVILSKGVPPNISIENHLNCGIKGIKNGKLLSEVLLDFESHELTAILSANALTNLNIEVGDHVLAMIKTNEIMISPC